MKHSRAESSLDKMIDEVLSFVGQSSGLTHQMQMDKVSITQKCDQKRISLNTLELTEVLNRVDSEGKSFLQLNLLDGRKLLLTDSLVGFKPFESLGLDMNKLPRVVTTPDLVSVIEAIEDALSSEWTHSQEVEVLKKVFGAILHGGELVGFDLQFEKKWMNRISASNFKASA